MTTERYYLPTQPKLVEEGKICGFKPWGRAHIPIGRSLHVAVDIHALDDRIALSLQLPLPEGTTVRFTEPEIGLEDPNSRKQYTARLERFRVSISGRNGLPGFYEYVEPNDILEGRGRNADLAGPDTQYMKLDLFISNAVVVATPAGSLILKLPIIPPAELNGGPVASQTISLRLVEKTGVLACVQ